MYVVYVFSVWNGLCFYCRGFDVYCFFFKLVFVVLVGLSCWVLFGLVCCFCYLIVMVLGLVFID